ncbi:MAG: redoxin family protein [Holophagales bacterium]|nr:redoxin family protein [Holophagales bacterium]
MRPTPAILGLAVFPILLLPLLLSTASAAAGGAAVEPAGNPVVGDAVPVGALALELEGVDGAVRPLSDWRRENGLLVLFASNTCPYVLDWADRFPILERLGEEKRIGVVVVNANARKRKSTDSPESMKAFAEEHLGDIPYLLDEGSRLADLLGAERTPEAVLIDAEGRLAYRGQIDDHSGPLAEVEQHYLRQAFLSLDGEGVLPEPTPPLGCAILRPRSRAPRP